MSDDYLWDRDGPTDPEVAHLERLLRPLGQQALPRLASSVSAPIRSRLSWPLLALAALVGAIISVGGWELLSRSRVRAPGWHVSRFAETSTSSSPGVPSERELQVGGWLETSDQEKARIKQGTDAVVRVCMIGLAIAIVAITPVTWGWKIALFLVIMLVVGIIMPVIWRATAESEP